MAHTVIGTAGHIDHGKTLLVKALTGTDTDRAPEEKARGITIELGFAFLGEEATIVDVPGHERFVKTMVAGVSAIDVALLVIAADDGVMPQSREHLDILELLGVRRGIVVVNKADLVDEDWLQLVEEEIAELVAGTFLEGAEVARVSALTGAGIEELRQALEKLIAATGEKRAEGPFRLPVDRAFVVKGFGMVCTGTVLSGELPGSGSVEVQPGGRRLRVRGLQKHGRAVPSVAAGDRAALNLPGIEQEEIRRGDVLCEDGVFAPTFMADARLRLLPSCPRELVQRARVRLHLGTAEVLGRVVLLDREVLLPGEQGWVQLRLESPVLAAWGDRFVIRRYSPALTIGGGRILNPHPEKHTGSGDGVVAALQGLDVAEPAAAVASLVRLSRDGMAREGKLAGDLGIAGDRLSVRLAAMEVAGDLVRTAVDNEPCVVPGEVWWRTAEEMRTQLAAFHEDDPLRAGMNREELRKNCAGALTAKLFERILEREEREGRVAVSGSAVRLAGHEISFTEEETGLRGRIEAELRKGKLEEIPDAGGLAPRLGADPGQVERILRALQSLGVVVHVEGSLVLHQARLRVHQGGAAQLSRTPRGDRGLAVPGADRQQPPLGPGAPQPLRRRGLHDPPRRREGAAVKRSLRAGVVGSGGMAAHRLRAFAGLEECRVTALASRNPATGAPLARQYGVPLLGDWRELVASDEVDAVVICTSNDSHGAIALAALEAGKPVFTEYPLARSLEEAESVVRTARDEGPRRSRRPRRSGIGRTRMAAPAGCRPRPVCSSRSSRA